MYLITFHSVLLILKRTYGEIPPSKGAKALLPSFPPKKEQEQRRTNCWKLKKHTTNIITNRIYIGRIYKT